MTIKGLVECLNDYVLKLIQKGSKNALYCSNNVDVIPNWFPTGVTTLDELVGEDYVWAYVINEDDWIKLDSKRIGTNFFRRWYWLKSDSERIGTNFFFKLDLSKFIIRGENMFKVLRSNFDSLNQDCTQCKRQILKNNGISIPSDREASVILQKILLGFRDDDTRRYLGNKEAYRNYEELVTSCKQRTGLTYDQLTELAFYTMREDFANTSTEFIRRYRNYLYDCFRYHGGIYKVLEDVYDRPLDEMVEVYNDKIESR